MTYQAYLDTIKEKTGKTPDDFRALAGQKGLAGYPEIMAWLKADFGLGHGHANVIAQLLAHGDEPKITKHEQIDRLFSGSKQKWRKAYDTLVAQLAGFGGDFRTAPTNTYVSLLRGAKKFGIIEPAAADHLDVGIKLKGAAPSGRFGAAGAWNAMVTHRVRINDVGEIDAEVLAWLKQAYDAAAG